MEIGIYRRIARDSLAGNWGRSILVAFVAALLGGTASTAGGSINLEDYQQLMQYEFLVPILKVLAVYTTIASIVSFILGGAVQLGYCTYLLKQYDNSEPKFADLFSHFSTNFGGGFCLKLLTSIYITLWSMLLIIPGIVKAYAYSMAPYIMAENPHLTAGQCLAESQALMKGHKFELFLLDLSFIGWILLSALTLGIGSILLTPYTSAARTAFYRDIAPGHIY